MRLLYYDGECPMCHRLVIWLLKRDHQKLLHFAAIQSEAAQNRLGEEHSALIEMDTVVLQVDQRIYTRSTAALKAIGLMPGWHLTSRILMLVPRVIRDIVYRFVANNRHRLWKSCPMIPPEYRDRFI